MIFRILLLVSSLLSCLNIKAQNTLSANTGLETNFGGKTASFEMTRNEVANVSAISVKNVSKPDLKYTLVGYDVTFRIKGTPFVSSHKDAFVYGLDKVDIGSKIFIDNVKVKDADGKILNATGVTIKVK